MDEKELEKTKPINILSDIKESREEKYKPEELNEESREERLKNLVALEETRASEEAAEEALAEKNIALAESYLNEEKNKEIMTTEEPPKKVSLIDKIKDKLVNLDKKQKIMLVVIALLLLFLLIILLVFIFADKKEEEKPNEPTPPVVDVAPTITDNYYYKDGNLYFIDENEKELGSYSCENKDSNLCYVAYNNARDGFDVSKLEEKNGKEKIGRMPIFENKYVFVVDNKEEKNTSMKLYSISEEKVIKNYKTAKSYSNNYIIVSDTNNKYGLIEIKENINEIIKPEYESLRMIDKEDNLIAKNKKGYVVINKKNKVLSSTFDSRYDIRYYNNNFIVAYVGDSYNLYNYKNDLLASDYEFITVNGLYAALVSSNKKIYLIDNEKNKFNEGNISVNNKNYIKTYIYDDKGDSKEVKRSFDMNIKESTIELVIYKNDEDPTYHNVEIVEGLVNKKNKFVNYFSGKLYFYKDEDKTELIGTYDCSNKNYISKDTDKHEYCFPAKDTIYEDNDIENSKRETISPLINDKFVFITDGPSTVKLYDLQENKVMGSYTSIDTNLPNNNYVFGKFNGKLDIIILNKKGKYGVLTIDGSVNAKYLFEYNHLEKLGDYILAQDTSNKWKILYGNERESGTVTGKIRGYSKNLKYIKVKTNNGYSVLSDSGEQARSRSRRFLRQ